MFGNFTFKVKGVTTAALKNVESSSSNLRRYEDNSNLMFSAFQRNN